MDRGYCVMTEGPSTNTCNRNVKTITEETIGAREDTVISHVTTNNGAKSKVRRNFIHDTNLRIKVSRTGGYEIICLLNMTFRILIRLYKL